MQLTHYNTRFKTRNFPITLVCDNVTNAPNVGSLFRIADAFGVEKIIFCGEPINIGRKVQKTSRATEKVVNFEIKSSINDVVKELKDQGHHIISLEITSNSMPINEFVFPNDQPIALVIGDENFGISDAVLKLSNSIVHINMFGQNSSMNVVQATNIALYEATKQLL